MCLSTPSCSSPAGRSDVTVTVREVRPEDHARVGRLVVDAYVVTGPFDRDYLDFLERASEWAGGATAVFVAERDGAVVGAVAFTLPGDPLFETTWVPAADSGFRFLAVEPSARGAGAGRALVQACVDAARAHGARRMVIHSMAFMTDAHRLYLRMGFVRRPDLDVRFPTGVGYAFQLDLADDADAHFPPPGPVPDAPPWFEDVWDV